MSSLYAFELGREKEICFAELISVLGEDQLVEKNLDTAVFKLTKEQEKDLQKLQDSLGGTIKIVEILKSLPNIINIRDIVQETLETEFKGHEGKIPFSICTLSYKNPRKEINIKDLLIFSKKILKSMGLNCRFVNKGPISPRPSTIYKAKVLQKGIDINIIKGLKGVFYGQTVAIQNIDNYSKRDYDKPMRDARVGMTPPKLAQIMLNLVKDAKTVYDPFCGTGTFLIEGMLQGKAVVGSDISPRMVDYTEKNCQWFQKEFSNDQPFRVFERDAKFITPDLFSEKIDAIVTEGYLGEPQSSIPTPQTQEMIFRELGNLHLNWLSAAKEITDTVVMCLTAFNTYQGVKYFPAFDELVETAGWKITQNHLYKRKDQIVVREIVVLKKRH